MRVTRLHTGHTLVGRVTIGRRVYLGHGAIVLPGSTIGDEAVIGPGAVVQGDTPARSVAIGNPAELVSDVATFPARCLKAIARDPVWPIPDWTSAAASRDERKSAPRDARRDRCGYLESPG